MKRHQIPLILAVDSQWMLGKMRLASGERVSDVLNDSMSDYVTLLDVKVFSPADRKRAQASLPEITVLKDHLQMAISPTDQYEIPKKQRLHRITEKFKRPGATIVGNCLVQGTFHLRNRTNDASIILKECLDHFFPVTSATISGSFAATVEAATVLANRSFASCISCREDAPPANAGIQASLSAESVRDPQKTRPLLVDLY